MAAQGNEMNDDDNLLHVTGLQKYFPVRRGLLKLKAGDAWRGFGYYQTLAGAMFRENSMVCAQYGKVGEVLKVELRKQ